MSMRYLFLFLFPLPCLGQTAAEMSIGLAGFIENQGQWDSPEAFRLHQNQYTVFLEPSRVTFDLVDTDALWDYYQNEKELLLHGDEPTVTHHAYRVNFVGSLPQPTLTGLQPAGTPIHYFLGNDSSRWKSNLEVMGKVVYEELYPSVDLHVYLTEEGNFKYDLIVAPHGNPSQIRLAYEGLDGLSIQKGTLHLETSLGTVIEQSPYTYQIIEGETVVVPSRFDLDEDEVGFIFPAGYDPEYPLIIDPVVVLATYSGDPEPNGFACTATGDKDGNLYGSMVTQSATFPASVGSYQVSAGGNDDAAVMKFSQDGTNLEWATYLGGSQREVPSSMMVDSRGNVCLYGRTFGATFPVTAGAFQTTWGGSEDQFVTRIASDGASLIGATYVGGSGRDGFNLSIEMDFTGEINLAELRVDANDNVIVASNTRSDDFPVTAGAYQTSRQGSQDGVVYKLDYTLSNMLMGSYVGGPGGDAALGVRIGQNGELYVVGGAAMGFSMPGGGAYPAYQGGSFDAFVLKLSADGSTALAGTFLGSIHNDAAHKIDLGQDDRVYLAGYTYGFGFPAGNFPTTVDAYHVPNSTQFISILDADLMTLESSGLIGAGSGGGPGGFGHEMVITAFDVDACGLVYYAGHQAVGYIDIDNNLPISPDAFSTSGTFHVTILKADATELYYGTYYESAGSSYAGTQQILDGKLFHSMTTGDPVTTTPNAWASQPPAGGFDMFNFVMDFEIRQAIAMADVGPSTEGCAPFSVSFTHQGSGDAFWEFGDGTTSTDPNPNHTYTTPGTYTVRQIVIDSGSCNESDTAEYVVTVLDGSVDATFTIESGAQCADTLELTLMPAASDSDSWLWDFGDGSTSQERSPRYVYTDPGDYTITLLTENTLCGTMDIQSQPIRFEGGGARAEAAFPNVFTPNGDGINEAFCHSGVGTVDYSRYELSIYDRWGRLFFHTNDSNHCWDGTFDGMAAPAGVYFWVSRQEGSCAAEQYDHLNKGSFTLLR